MIFVVSDMAQSSAPGVPTPAHLSFERLPVLLLIELASWATMARSRVPETLGHWQIEQ
jgi:hypothetical protein